MAYDSSKPVTGGSLVAADMRENFRALKEDDIVEGVANNGIVTAMIANANVTQAKLKTSQGSVSVAGPQRNVTLPGGEYGFYPQTKSSRATSGYEVLASIAGADATGPSTAYITNIFLGNEAGVSSYAQQRYVTSSGEVFWIFILRDKITKDIKAMYQAPDHPCFGNGKDPVLVSHPFGSYDPDKHEIVVVNPTKEDVAVMQNKCIRNNESNKDLLEIITEEYEIDEESTPSWPDIPVTVGLPDEASDWKTMQGEASIEPIKEVIPKPSYITSKSLKLKEVE